jgi:hypothetical protein
MLRAIFLVLIGLHLSLNGNPSGFPAHKHLNLP